MSKPTKAEISRIMSFMGAKGGKAGKGKKVDSKKMRAAADARWSKHKGRGL